METNMRNTKNTKNRKMVMMNRKSMRNWGTMRNKTNWMMRTVNVWNDAADVNDGGCDSSFSGSHVKMTFLFLSDRISWGCDYVCDDGCGDGHDGAFPSSPSSPSPLLEKMMSPFLFSFLSLLSLSQFLCAFSSLMMMSVSRFFHFYPVYGSCLFSHLYRLCRAFDDGDDLFLLSFSFRRS